jgi:hypothetical protein
MDPPWPNRHPDVEAGGPAVAQVGVLTGDSGTMGAAALLLGRADLTLRTADSVDGLLEVVRGGAVQAVVVDPEVGGGWPVDVADRLAVELRAAVPLILVCGIAHDATLIEQRINRADVRVLLREHLTPEQLAVVVRGAIAGYRGPSAIVSPARDSGR